MSARAGVLHAGVQADHAAPHRVISGTYELLQLKSSGGVGSIWIAHNRRLANRVAIKFLHEHLMSEELHERLKQEARLAARVEHRNIVRVLDLGVTEWNAPYVVMELLEGRDLAAELDERGRLPPVVAVQLLVPVLEGLAHAHERHIVHRDLKPANIFLDRSEGEERVVPKIVDFGIARCLTDLQSSRITRSGSVFGTVHYLSPEQALGQDDVDQRADVWGFCAVLYECITGQPPFGEREPGAALRAVILEDIPPPSEVGVDDGLGRILAKGLARDRRQRWPDVRSLGQALSTWLIERGVDADISGHSLSSRWFGGSPLVRVVPITAEPGEGARARREALTQAGTSARTLRR